MTAQPAARCGSRLCPHKAHRGRCTGKGPSHCVPFDEGIGRGFICGAKPPCPCPWRTCRCGVDVAVAACADEPEFEETVERGSANHPQGTLAVRALPDGSLVARPIPAGGELREGEMRAIDHDARCPQAKRRGVVDVTGPAGQRIPA